MIAAGSLRHRVTLQSRVVSRDANGTPINAWIDAATVWAAIQPMSARDFIAAQSVQSRVDTRIVIRWRGDVNATMQVLHDADIYSIHGLLPDVDSGREYLTLVCSKLDPPVAQPSSIEGGNAASAGSGSINGGNA